jgi:predicted O-linked N-acetylglucosamine transferase (SPINDLY family)
MDVLSRTMAFFGLDPARIVFAPEVQPNQHRARLRLADIGLDTWPYGSHTTAMDLLSAGVPMVTIAGPTHPMRVGASMLKAFRLDELVTTTVDEFVNTASRLAFEPAFASPVRDRLANASARDAVASRLAGQAREFSEILGQVRADFGRAP